MSKRLLSGIRISGVTHIGNYFGAIRQWVEMQNNFESYVFLADLHGLTTPFNPKEIELKTLETAKLYLSLGIDPKKTIIFVQSHLGQHAQLAWILGSIAYMGELSRQTAFKEKSARQKSINLGLFSYPVLMAADILLYKPDVVPVGEDQKQHVELARDLAQRFNQKFGQTFKIPEIQLTKDAARIMGLDDASKKMSKSAKSENNYIGLLDGADKINKKIKSAVTDSGNEVVFDPNKPAVSNLINLYSLSTGLSPQQVEKEFSGRGYKEFKSSLSEALINFLQPVQEKYYALTDQETKKVLRDGAQKAAAEAESTLNEVKQKIGLLSNQS